MVKSEVRDHCYLLAVAKSCPVVLIQERSHVLHKSETPGHVRSHFTKKTINKTKCTQLSTPVDAYTWRVYPQTCVV